MNPQTFRNENIDEIKNTYCDYYEFKNRREQREIKFNADLKKIIEANNKIKELKLLITNIKSSYPLLKDCSIETIKSFLNN